MKNIETLEDMFPENKLPRPKGTGYFRYSILYWE